MLYFNIQYFGIRSVRLGIGKIIKVTDKTIHINPTINNFYRKMIRRDNDPHIITSKEKAIELNKMYYREMLKLDIARSEFTEKINSVFEKKKKRKRIVIK